MKKQLNVLLIIIISIALILSLVLIDLTSGKKLEINNGTGNFSEQTIDNYYYLVGDWEVYYDYLIISENIDYTNMDTQYLKLPKVFNNNETKYMSYRVVIKNFPNKDVFVNIDGYLEGYAVYLNGVLTKTNNKLSKDNNIIPLGDVTNYKNNEANLEIIIEVSCENGNTSLTRTPQLFDNSNFNKRILSNIVFKYIVIGALLFALLYHIIVYGFRSKHKSTYFFALFNLSGIINLIYFNSPYTLTWTEITNANEPFFYTIHHLSYYFSSLFLFLLIINLSSVRDKKQIYLLLIIVLNILIPIIIPSHLFINFLYVFNLINIVFLILILIYTITHLKQETFSKYFILMITMILLGNIYDTLIHTNIIAYGEEIIVAIYITCILIYSSIIANIHEKEISKAEEIINLNKKIRDTEFSFLNSQIQSHFIYNTLNSIQALCNTNPPKASDLIEDFSMYLRTRLEFNKMPMLINFEDELENIRTYLSIEKERFGSRVNFTYDLQAGEFKIPPLSVQPLVENAVKHGISKKKLGGFVKISSYKEKNNIFIKIEDNGVGFNPESLDEKQRVGTENIRHRLHLHINATLTIMSKINEGTISIIKIPNDDEVDNL